MILNLGWVGLRKGDIRRLRREEREHAAVDSFVDTFFGGVHIHQGNMHPEWQHEWQTRFLRSLLLPPELLRDGPLRVTQPPGWEPLAERDEMIEAGLRFMDDPP